jgi:hypothetical protein
MTAARTVDPTLSWMLAAPGTLIVAWILLAVLR